ncbi:MAG: hypothetical protein ACKPCM_17395 [Pseudanabaena sp.]
MASIVLSFVGQQDPFGSKTGEGSIVTLIRALVSQGTVIKRAILIYTEGTATGAKETKEWLVSELGIDGGDVELVPASWELSNDPTDLLKAAQEARRGLDLASVNMEKGDRVEFNASSGTPAMKSAFSILQAAGYATNGTVWQVRNPNEMREGQSRVFATDVGVLRQEFDRKVIQKQIADYSYAGALESLRFSSLANDQAIAFLEYGRCRMAFDFDAAFNNLQSLDDVPSQLLQEIGDLRQRKLEAIARELYFNAVIRYSNREFSEFLVLLSQFQECVLAFLIKKKLGLDLPNSYQDAFTFWERVRTIDGGKPLASLRDLYQKQGWQLTMEGFTKRPQLIGLLSCYRDLDQLFELINFLNGYCEQRNRCVHRFEGISELDNGEEILAKLKRLIRMLVALPSEDPFDVLNRVIYGLLSSE